MGRKRRKAIDRERRLERELEPMVPAQLFRLPGHGALQPEKRLMLAVMDDAVSAALREPEDRECRASLAWMASDDLDWPYSFANVCATLGLDRRAVREALARRRQGTRAPAAA